MVGFTLAELPIITMSNTKPIAPANFIIIWRFHCRPCPTPSDEVLPAILSHRRDCRVEVSGTRTLRNVVSDTQVGR